MNEKSNTAVWRHIFCAILCLLVVFPYSLDPDSATAAEVNPMDNITIRDLSGHNTKLIDDYQGHPRLIIGGRPSCGNTASAVRTVLGLASSPLYKNVQFFILDVDGDKAAFQQAYGASGSTNVTFASTNDPTYNTWFWSVYRRMNQASEQSIMLPFTVAMDTQGSVVSATAGPQNLEFLMQQHFGIAPNVGRTTEVTLGTNGVTVYTTEVIDQQDVYTKALQRVAQWRRDALNDAQVKFDYEGTYMSIPDLLSASGISQSDYLNPQWSNGLERIALQRSVEQNAQYGHIRPNQESVWTARYNGTQSNAEVLAWKYWNINDAIDGWASEKADYIKEVRGEPHGVTGHYTFLVNPKYRYYGFAGCDYHEWGGVWAGQAAVRLQDSQTPLNLKGAYEFSMNVSEDRLNQGVTLDVPASMDAGASHKAMAKLKYMDGRYELRGAWTSSDPSVLSVESGSILKALKPGRATVTLSSQGKSYSTTVSVVVPVSSVSVSGGAFSLEVGGSTRFKATVSPANATDKTVTWSSSDAKVATVDANGKVSAKAAGTTTITAKVGGKSASVKVTVKTPVIAVSSVSVSGGASSLQVGGSTRFTATVAPANATDKTVTWASSDTKVATVDANGTVSAKAAGTVTVTAKAGGKTASVKVTVSAPKPPVSFTDVSGSTPHSQDILWLAQAGVSTGYTNADGSFRFEGMTVVYRQDMAAFLRREARNRGVVDAASWKPSAADWKRFRDVNKSTPHAEDILWLAHAGISTGWKEKDGTCTFRGMSPVVRQDMAAFLKRLAAKAGKAGGVRPKTDFTDVTAATPHRAEIQWLGGSGISQGYRNNDGSWRFEGMTSVYRQDMAAFIHRLDNQLNK